MNGWIQSVLESVDETTMAPLKQVFLNLAYYTRPYI